MNGPELSTTTKTDYRSTTIVMTTTVVPNTSGPSEAPASIISVLSVSTSSTYEVDTTITSTLTSSVMSVTTDVNSAALPADMEQDKSVLPTSAGVGVALAGLVGVVIVLGMVYRRRRKKAKLARSEGSQSSEGASSFRRSRSGRRAAADDSSPIGLLSARTHLPPYSLPRFSQVSDEESRMTYTTEVMDRPPLLHHRISTRSVDEQLIPATLMHPLASVDLDAAAASSSACSSSAHSYSTEKGGDPAMLDLGSDGASSMAHTAMRSTIVSEELEAEPGDEETDALQEGQILYELDGGICLEGGPPGLSRRGALRSSRPPALTLTLPPPYQLY